MHDERYLGKIVLLLSFQRLSNMSERFVSRSKSQLRTSKREKGLHKNDGRTPNTKSETSFREFRLVISDHLLKTHINGPLGLPPEGLLSATRVRSPLLRIIRRDRLVNDIHWWCFHPIILHLHLPHRVPNPLGKVPDRELVTVTDVHWPRLVRVHQRDETVDQIMNVLERPRLGTVPINGHVLPPKRLHDEV